MRVFSIVRQQRRTHWAWVGPAIGAAGALASALIGAKAAKDTAGAGILSLGEQKELFNFQQNRLEKQQNSAHQREVQDLRKAGLNPILSAGGQGAASGLASPIDVNAYNSARSAANQQRINARLQVAQGLMDSSSRLMDYAIQKQNANTNEKQADAAMMNAETNAANSASQIALNKENEKYLNAFAKKALDDLLTNSAVRANLSSQSALNYTSAHRINYLLDSERQLNEANANSGLFKFGYTQGKEASKQFQKIKESLKDESNKRRNSAKQKHDDSEFHWSTRSVYGGYY